MRHRTDLRLGSTPPEKRVLDDLFSVAYEELRRLASSVKRRDGSQTLNPTALVNEAWLKLAKSPGFETTSLLHFKRIAARARCWWKLRGGGIRISAEAATPSSR